MGAVSNHVTEFQTIRNILLTEGKDPVVFFFLFHCVGLHPEKAVP